MGKATSVFISGKLLFQLEHRFIVHVGSVQVCVSRSFKMFSLFLKIVVNKKDIPAD